MKHYEYKSEGWIEDWGTIAARLVKEDEFQASLSPRDPRHWKMFEYETDDNGAEWLLIYWGGYEYPYEMSRITRPDDLLWLIAHLGEKSWEHIQGYRVRALIFSVAQRKGWQPFGVAPHPNEAPKPNHDKIGERHKMTSAMRYEVIKRDLHRCRACGFSVQDGAHLHVDHIVPVAKGGRTEIGNLQTLCTACNLGKGAK